jgi:hypothetical protein
VVVAEGVQVAEEWEALGDGRELATGSVEGIGDGWIGCCGCNEVFCR